MSSPLSRDEDVDHLRRADPVDDADTGLFEPGVGHRLWQELARRNAALQRAEVAAGELGRECAIRERRGEEAGHAMLLDCREHGCRRRRLDRHGRRAESQRKHQQRPEPEGETRAAGCRRRRHPGAVFSRCRATTSAIASTSRWKCMQALGWPVVPDVNASRQTSSDAVSALANRSEALAPRALRGRRRPRR